MMNLKTWMKIGGIITVLLGTAPMLAVAQSYGSPQFDERNLVDVRNGRNARYHCHRQQFRNSRGYSYSRRYCHTHSYRGTHSHRNARSVYPLYNNRYNRNNHNRYQSR
ncbi:MAG: hypothetical protein HC889_08860 [Synechococcaceae cyanobacterium SM1_2_3]|nr:hypothetical protein [Synechococcaceae cyanobacterium SM1_2_3]